MPATAAYADSDTFLYDYADVLTDSQEQSAAQSLKVVAFTKLAVFIYTDSYEYEYNLNRLSQSHTYIALLIQVDKSGNYKSSKVMHSNSPSYIPSEDFIDNYHRAAKKHLKNEEYRQAIAAFFDPVASYVYKAHLYGGIDTTDDFEEEFEKDPLDGHDDKASSGMIILGIVVSAILGIVLGARHTKRLLKQLKTVQYSKDAEPYINKEYVSIKSEMVDRGLLSLFF